MVHVHLTNVIVVDDGGQWPSNLTSEETVPFSLLCACSGVIMVVTILCHFLSSIPRFPFILLISLLDMVERMT